MPICDLLGGRCRDWVPIYAHASTVERGQELVERGYTALKAGSLTRPVEVIHDLRTALGDDVDLCIDVHGPPWFSVPDASRVGQALEEYDLLFYIDGQRLIAQRCSGLSSRVSGVAFASSVASGSHHLQPPAGRPTR